jgi:hypothetical protein
MKKALSLLLAVCLFITAFSVNAFAADSSQEANANLTKEYTEAFLAKFNRGDLDGDNKVTVEEAAKVLRVAAKLDEPAVGIDYDLNADGKISTEDARRALRIASGLEIGATNEEIFEYFKNELNTVKASFPGFERKTTSTCKSAKIAIKSNPESILDTSETEFIDYIEDQKSMFILLGKKAEYEELYADALAKYEPVVSNKVIAPGSSSHYSYFPVATRPYSCYLSYEDIKGITIKESNGQFIITLTMNNYTYDEKNPYPATAYEDDERLKLPYGKIFNIPQFSEAEVMDITKVVLDKGKVVLKVDSTTGKIDDVDYFYRCSVTGVLVETIKDDNGNEIVMTTTMKNVIENQEYFKMK